MASNTNPDHKLPVINAVSKQLSCLLIACFLSSSVLGQEGKEKYTHYIGVEFRPAFVIPSSPFFKSDNSRELPVKHSLSGHLKYSFSLPSGTLGSQVFATSQQGIGLAYFDFGNSKELGNPVVAYLFQNAAITGLSERVSLNYEWNFGLSTGWKPYNPETNPRNVIIGSGANAYINLGMYIKWKFSHRLALTTGADFTHFSNGNTEYPNSGFNAWGFKAGLLYNVLKDIPVAKMQKKQAKVPEFRRHVSYDLVVFGSWRRKGVDFFGSQVASPDKYPVLGLNVAPMYNLGYRFRTGLSLDAIYDGSANVYTEDFIVGTQQEFFKPKWDRQVALGVSARAEYVMPIFTIGVGAGTNLLHKGGDFRGTYQIFALKIRTGRSSFMHIGYNIKDFHEPNYLMLGLGYSFNTRTPSLLSK